MRGRIIDTGLIWLWVTAVVVILDQLSKQMVVAQLLEGQRVQVMPFFDLTLAYNTGAAFSFLADAAGWQRWFFSAIAIGVSVFILGWLRRLPRSQVWTAVTLALILGGALGNVWDRLAQGKVTDFLLFYAGKYEWPAFNIADSAISVGAVMMILEMLWTARRGDKAGD